MSTDSTSGDDDPVAVVDDPLRVIIVHRERPDEAARAAACFARQSPAVRVWVLDNGSSPGALARLRRLLPAPAEVIPTGANLGFGPGANVGLRRWLAEGAGRWVVVAPHDAQPDPGCLPALLAAVAARPTAGLACAEFGPGLELVPAVDWVLGDYARPGRRRVGWQEVAYPHGTLLVARRETLEEIGLFDERFFAYCEEVDLGLRAWRAGWEVGMVWGAVVRNAVMPTRPVADYLQLRNTLLLVRSWYGRYPAAVRTLLAGVAFGARCWRKPRAAAVHAQVHALAVADFARRRFGPPPGRVWSLAARAGASTGS